MGRIKTKFIFVSIKKPTAIWSQLGLHQLEGVTGYEATSRSQIKGFIEGLRTMHRLTKTPLWFTCGLRDEDGINHNCRTSVDDEDVEFVCMQLWDDE